MRRRLLDWVACPLCGGPLRLEAFETAEDEEEIEEGILACGCTAAFPVLGGVPRIVEGALHAQEEFRRRRGDRLRESGVLSGKALQPASPEFRALVAPTMDRFGKEWEKHPLEETTWGLDQTTRLQHALRYLGWTAEEAKGRVVLDAGCGTGKLTCGMASWGGEVVGVDLNPSAARGWHARRTLAGDRAASVHIVQGDLMHPPFRSGSFDGVHSAGVLHHTPDTLRAFRAVAPLVKPGGSLGVWLYKVGHEEAGRLPWLPFVRGKWASIPFRTLRPWTTGMAPSVLYALLFAYAAVFHAFYAAGALLRGRRHGQTIRERTTSLFDSLAPPFVWHHTVPEVVGWFEAAGFHEVVETTVPGDDDGFCVTGRRKA